MKPMWWQRLIESWPMIAALAGIAITWHVQITILEYRLNRTENEIVSLKNDAKENLEKLASSVQKLQLDVQTLVTLMQRDKISNY
jgi:hypothetical protein